MDLDNRRYNDTFVNRSELFGARYSLMMTREASSDATIVLLTTSQVSGRDL